MLNFVIFILVFVQNCSAQHSPIQWINRDYFIHIDTISNKKPAYSPFYYYNTRTNFMNFTFKNNGTHVVFIDTNLSNSNFNKYIAKPSEIQTVSLTYLNFKGLDNWKKRDTVSYLSLPFYYEGKLYKETVACHLSFGKSKLIEHSALHIDTSQWIESFVNADTSIKNPSLKFTHYFSIKNISDKPIYCTQQFIAWNDSQNLKNPKNEYEKILPGQTYKIPAQINMDRKYRFNCQGIIEVFTDDTSETFECQIKSNYQPKNK